MSVVCSIQDEPRLFPGPRHKGAHYHADVIYLLPLLEIRKVIRALRYSYIKAVPDQHFFYPDEQYILTFYNKFVPPVDHLSVVAHARHLSHSYFVKRVPMNYIGCCSFSTALHFHMEAQMATLPVGILAWFGL